jgi:Ca2+-binding RTX toxin-like protein
MPSSPSSFGINLSSSNYTSINRNKFVGVPGHNGNPNWLWCTEFAYGRALEKGLITPSSGVGAKVSRNAEFWDDQVGSWSSQARANSFIIWDRNGQNHVAFVESVNSDGSLTITEGNYNWNGGFNSRTLSPAQYSGTKFIHLGGGSTPTPPPTPSGRVFQGTQGSERIDGSNFHDTLIGAGGNDTLYGEAGNDFLAGGDGNDYLDGYASFNSREFDTLQGGAGIDIFVLGNTRQGAFYQGDGHAVIADYNFRDDYIQLRGSASQYKLTRQGNDTLVQMTNGDTLAVVQNVTDLSLTPRPGRVDFQFI